MSETYVPRVGDRVRFYSWAARMDLYGEVLSVSPQSRMANVREDHEEGETFMKSWDVLRLVESAAPDHRANAWKKIANQANGRARALESRVAQAENRSHAWWETAKTYCRANRTLAETVNAQERQIASYKERQNSIADERDNWMCQAIANKDRAEKAEAALAQQIDATSAHFSRVRELDKRLTDMTADRDGWAAENADTALISRIGYEERDQALARATAAEAELAELKSTLRTLAGESQ